MKQNVLIALLLLINSLSFGQAGVKKIVESDFSVGKAIEIESQILGESRNVNIYLPLSYSEDSLRAYPVIYLLDGSRDEDFIHISGLVQFGSFSWIKMIPETIVVGIGNVDRKRDFTYPSNSELDQKEFPSAGKSERFIQFIQKELQPFVDANFRTGKEETLIGQSLGGLLATEILFKAPDLFDNYIIVSPSLWWDDESLLDYKPKKYEGEKSIYIAVGKEGENMERTARELYNKLLAQRKESTMLYFDFLEGKSHGDALHEAAYHAFEKMFKAESEDDNN